MSAPNPYEVAALVAATLERLQIPYVIGGSIASSIHGEMRTTFDVDFAVHLRRHHASLLEQALARDFHVDRKGIEEAIATLRPFNAVHARSMTKVDFHVRPSTGIYAEEVRRARLMQIAADPEAMARVATPEDVVLQKLHWYRLGDCVSERQWRDVVGVLKQQRATIDRIYLDRWARELGLLDLLERAAKETGLQDRDQG